MGIVTGYLSQLVSSGIKLLNNGTAVSSSNTAGFTEINSELRIDFLSGLAVTTDGSGGSLYFSGSGTSGRRTSLTVKT